MSMSFEAFSNRQSSIKKIFDRQITLREHNKKSEVYSHTATYSGCECIIPTLTWEV